MYSSKLFCVFFIVALKPLHTAADRPQGRDDGEGRAGSGKHQQMITSNDAMATRDEWWKKTFKKDADEQCRNAVEDMIAMCEAAEPHPECTLTGETVTVECDGCGITKTAWDEQHGRPWKDGKGSENNPNAFKKEVKDGNQFTIWNPACFVPDAAPTATTAASTDTSGSVSMVALANHLGDELAKVNAQVISLEEYTFKNGTPGETECDLTAAELLPETAFAGLDTLDLVTVAQKMSLVVQALMGKLYCLQLAIRGPGTGDENEKPEKVAAKGVKPLLHAIAAQVGKLQQRAGSLKDDVIGESGAL